MTSLAERVEALDGACREVDAEIWCIVGVGSAYNEENCWLASTVRPPELESMDLTLRQWLDRFPQDVEKIAGMYNVPHYTGSLDAAMTLVPEGWRILTISEQNFDGERPWVVRIAQRGAAFGRAKTVRSIAATLALALTAAALRAIEDSK